MSAQPCYYQLMGPDNGSFWLPTEDKALFCAGCGSKLTRSYHGADFYLKKKNYDVSCTYDGFLVVSAAFRRACEALGLDGIGFTAIPADERYPQPCFVMEVDRVLSIDVDRAAPEFGEICGECGQHRFVVGARDVYIRPMRPLVDGLWRSDLEFADGREKAYAVIAGTETARELARLRLRGLVLEPVIDGST